MKVLLWVCMPRNKQYGGHFKYMILRNKTNIKMKSRLRLLKSRLRLMKSRLRL